MTSDRSEGSAGYRSEQLSDDDSVRANQGTRPRFALRPALRQRRISLHRADEMLDRFKAIRGTQKLPPIELERTEIRILSKLLQPVISYTNGMGGASKSTIALYHGNIHADTTRRTTFLLPTTEHVEMASGGMYAGIQPEDNPLDILHFAELCDKYASYWDISPDIPVTPYGLHVISEPYSEKADMEFRFETERYLSVFDRARSASDCMILDHGNDGIRLGSIVLEAVRRSHVACFTATADNRKTLQKLAQIMRTYASDEFAQNPPDGSAVRDPSQIPTVEKILHAPVIISKVEKKQTVEDFMEFLDVPGYVGPVLTVPRDNYIEGEVISRLEHLNPKTYAALVHSHLVALRQAAKLAGVDLAPLEVTPQQ